MLIEPTNFERISSGLLFGSTWTQVSSELPTLFTRHGKTQAYGNSSLPNDEPAIIEHFTMTQAQWYLQNFHHSRRYRFAGWAKLLQVVYFGMPDRWAERLFPFPWCLALIGRPGDLVPEYLPEENRLKFSLTPLDRFILRYSDATGVWIGHVPRELEDRMLFLLSGLEADPGEPNYPDLELDHETVTLIDESVLITSPYVVI